MKVEANTGKAVKDLKSFGASVDGTKDRLSILDKQGMAVARKAFLAFSPAVVAGTAAIKKYADKVAAVGDKIAKSAKRVGVSVEQYQKLTFAFEHCAISAGTLEKASRALFGSKWEGDVEGAINHIMAIEDKTERAAEAQRIFGNRTAQAMYPLLMGTKTLAEYNAELEKLGYWSQAATDNSEDYQDAMQDFRQSLQVIQVALAEELLPVITDIIQSLTDWISSHKEQIHNFFKGLGLIFQFLAKHGEDVAAVMLGVGAALMILSGPVGIITLAVTALVAIVTALAVHWDEIKKKREKKQKISRIHLRRIKL